MRSAEEWQRLVGPRRWAEMNDPAHPCRDCGAPGFRVFAQNKDTGLDACVNHEERAVLEGLAAQRAARPRMDYGWSVQDYRRAKPSGGA